MSLSSEHQKSHIPILGKATYTQWAFRCREYLESRNVCYVIDTTDATSKQLHRLALFQGKAPIDAAARAIYDEARDKIIEDSAIARAFIREFVDDTNSQHRRMSVRAHVSIKANVSSQNNSYIRSDVLYKPFTTAYYSYRSLLQVKKKERFLKLAKIHQGQESKSTTQRRYYISTNSY